MFLVQKNWIFILSLWLLIIVVLVALFLRVSMIAKSMPYPGHVDEPLLTTRAANILITGDFNPHFFNYPSLPIYLTAIGFTIGYLDSASHLEVKTTKEIGSVSFPYYTHPRIVWPSKVAFAIFSVIAMIFLGNIAYQIFPNPFLLFSAPFILMLSDFYFYESYKYLNVDIIGCFFVTLVYVYLFHVLQKDTVVHKSVVPGILSGLAVASKYTLVLITIPALLVILCYSKKKLYRVVLLMIMMIFTFFLVVPYSFLDLSTFLNHIGTEVYHYKSGHKGFEAISGFPQLMNYLNAILEDFGRLTSVVVIIGIITLLQKSWKNTLILLSFPLSFLVYMSTQRVYFNRNILSLYTFYALLAAAGVIGIWKILHRILDSLSFLKFSTRLRHLVLTSIVGGIVGLCFPFQRPMSNWMESRPDSRNLSVDWIFENIPKASSLIVPVELGMDIRSLQKDDKIIQFAFKELEPQTFCEKIKTFGMPYILMPVWGSDYKYPSGRKLAEKLNQLNVCVETIQHFSGGNVLTNNNPPVPQGNPKFSIGHFR